MLNLLGGLIGLFAGCVVSVLISLTISRVVSLKETAFLLAFSSGMIFGVGFTFAGMILI